MPSAIVTGASRGLGYALADVLVTSGWRVVVDARDAEALAAAASRLGPSAVPVPGDVTDPQHRAALLDAAGDDLDLLVNNAGILGPQPTATARRPTRSTPCARCTRSTWSPRSP